MPYNYLLDPATRNSLKVQWAGSIVIFDEAHNLEGIASEAASCELSSMDVAGAFSELDQLLTRASQPGYESVLEGAAVDRPSLEDLVILKAIVMKLEEEIEAVCSGPSINNLRPPYDHSTTTLRPL